jgi:exodeoxyribonuclease VII large subunit
MSLFDDAELGTGEPTFSVAELSDRIGNAVRAAFRDEVWVRGEIRDLTRARSGHVYFTLVDPDPTLTACLSVMLSDRNRGPVNRSLRAAGDAVRMTDGTEVRIRGRLDWYGPRGQLQLRMAAIDPAYTLGQLEVARAQLLARLDAEGLLRANARHPMPLVPLRLALITSRGSAAEADFSHELERSGFAFDVVRLDARVQGFDAPLDVVAALEQVPGLGVDVVALVRGGGARTDLAAFDDERVARAIAACPVPVLTGIGHEIDRSIADEVAHTAEKTPTACAHRLVLQVAAFAQALEDRWRAVALHAGRAVQSEAARLDRLADRARRAASAGAASAGTRLDHRAERVERAAEAHLRTAGSGAADRARRLAALAPRALADAERSLGAREARVHALDPARTLARGWSITRTADGRVVRSPSEVAAGEVLVTQVRDGSLRSTVTPGSTVDADG